MINIESDKIRISVNPLGAELSSAVMKSTGREYIWQGDPTVWSGHAPILFPICGRLSKDTFLYDGERYSMPKHGFARRREFEILEITQNSVSFVLRSDAKTHLSYPFDFELGVAFSVDENVIKTVYSVMNTGSEKMYFSIGAHPAFNVQLGGSVVLGSAGKIETLTVNGDALIDGSRIISENGDRIVITEDVFENDAVILKSPKFRHVSVVDADGKTLVKMKFGKTPYLLFWAKPGAPFVCVEPWHGIPDSAEEPKDISEKNGIISLEPNEKFEFETEIELVGQK